MYLQSSTGHLDQSRQSPLSQHSSPERQGDPLQQDTTVASALHDCQSNSEGEKSVCAMIGQTSWAVSYNKTSKVRPG